FAFCCTFRRLTPPRCYLAPRPPEPGLSSTFREKCSDRPADLRAHHNDMAHPVQVVIGRPSYLPPDRPESSPESSRARAYASLRFAPVSRAASAAALLGASSPSSTLRVASSCAPSSATAAGAAPDTTTVISPRVKFASARASPARLASVP